LATQASGAEKRINGKNNFKRNVNAVKDFRGYKII
jgi:hypothetical protein